MNDLKISILTPAFNSGPYLERAVVSVLQQDYSNWEHIVVDGASTDETVDILKRYDHLIWISENDDGQSDAMNKAFDMSTGDMIIYLNADDYFYPGAFKAFLEQFQENPEVDMVVGNLDMKIGDRIIPVTNATISWKDLSVLRNRFPLNPVSYMYKRTVQERIGNFPVEEHFTMDYWFLIRAFYLFKVHKFETILGCFDFVDGNKSGNIEGEYQVQKPHALKFCREYTPLRYPYVLHKLFWHRKNPSRLVRLAYRITNRLLKIAR